MTTPSSTIVFMLLSLALMAMDTVESGAIPNEAMRQASSLDEFLAAQENYAEEQRGDSTDLRRRSEEVQRRLQDPAEIGPKLASEYDDGAAGFYHGVASGSPLPDAIVLWTRWTPETEEDVVELEFRMAMVSPDLAVEEHLDPSKNDEIKRGRITVSIEHDWTAKIDVTGLEAGASYVYGFIGPNGETSRVGLTKTAPALDADVDQVQYAVFSCSHFSNGYFHAYDIASTLTELDFWIHMGDYIYEYGTYSSYATGAQERYEMTDPVWEIVDVNDYRRRYALYHTDEGLQNLRARAPQMSIWDDHETMNDSHGDGNPETSGAENHQETCPANRTSPDEDKAASNCDRDEGSIVVRLNNAAKAYMEWMPIRKGPFDSMGFVETDLTQVVEWGNLATFVLIDTRVTGRSAGPTGESTFGNFGAAFVETNISAYEEEPLASIFADVHTATMAEINNPEYTMIGSSKVQFLRDTLENSKNAGKPWQVFGSATMMGPSVPPNMNTMSQYAPNDAAAGAVQAIVDGFIVSDSAGLFRAAVAMALTKTPWNLDDYNGFGEERKIILDSFRDLANNGIILGGDLHDNWAWQMYEGGAMEGTPVAINLGAPGVSSPGWGPFFAPIFGSIAELLGGEEGIYELVNGAFEEANTGLVYGDVGKKGFFVVTANKEESNIEYYGKPPSEILVDFETARADNGGAITASYSCGAHLVSTAGEPGSLVEVEVCEAKFDTERPAVWSIPLGAAEEPAAHVIDACVVETCTVEASMLKEEGGGGGNEGGGDSAVPLLSFFRLMCLSCVALSVCSLSFLM